MAIESPWIEAEAIEASEFQQLAEENKVSGVPQTTINHGKVHLVGAVSESTLSVEIQKAIGA
jgi:hypothetical protein